MHIRYSKWISSLLVLMLLLLAVFTPTGSTARAKARSVQLTDAASIPAVVKAMTLEEKASLVVGIGMPGVSVPVASIPGAVGGTHSIARLGIPGILFADGPAGVRIRPIQAGKHTYYATAFPIASALASTWDTDMAWKVGVAQGNELKEYGLDVLLAPAINIQRNPLNGRNFEYYSEDPLLSGKMAAANVQGVQSNAVGATVKHFAANNQETNRIGLNTIVSQRSLREIYLKGFEIAIKEAQPWAVMSSYNKINGVPTSQNPELLTTILRDEWGFKGAVMTDWYAGTDPVAMVIAGNDLMMPGTDQEQTIITAVKRGDLDVAFLDRNVAHILNLIIQTPTFKDYQPSNRPDAAQHAQVSREAAREGMVLLKNVDKTLPLPEGSKLAVFGTAQIETIKGGTGSGDVNSVQTVSIADGLRQAGFTLNKELYNSYSRYITELRGSNKYKITPSSWGIDFGYNIPVIPEMPLDAKTLSEAVNTTDVGIIVVGRNSGEGVDRTVTKGDFLLTDTEADLINNISAQYHAANKKVVVVLNIGGPMDVISWRDQVDGLLLAWQPGQEAGHAVADVLSGAVNPSGKLITTFPKYYSDVPSAAHFADVPVKNPTQVIYKEAIYVGYRYYETFGVVPAYAFGYGLSYTNYKYSDLALTDSSLTGAQDSISLTASVSNVGQASGKEVVQVYVHAPKKRLEQPALQLKAFSKTAELAAGQSQTMNFTINAHTLASFDEAHSCWVVEAGTYTVYVAASSEDVRGKLTFTVADDIVVEKVNDVLENKYIGGDYFEIEPRIFDSISKSGVAC